MSNFRLSRGLCAIVAGVLNGSHPTLDALFQSAGAPLPPPNLPHTSKWKEWLFRAGTSNDPSVDSLSVLGNILEEFMDVTPDAYGDRINDWKQDKDRVVQALEENGLRYFRGGRILPNGQTPQEISITNTDFISPAKPAQISQLLEVVLKGLRRSMHPLTHRRKGAQSLVFTSEYDVQDLLHALLRPWVADIRPEEFAPSYAGTNTRMDFLLPKHRTVIELKFVRDKGHAKKIGDELIIDISHYQGHPDCEKLWCVVYDQDHLLVNAEGLKNDLEGDKSSKNGKVNVKVLVL